MLEIQQEINEVMSLRDDADLTFKQIGDRLGFSESTAKRRYRTGTLAQAAAELVDSTLEEEEPLPKLKKLKLKVKSKYLPNELPEIKRFKPLTVEADNIMVTSDWHLPLYDADLANAMINIATEEKIKKLIIAGDLFNMDSFSSYLPHQPEAEFSREKVVGNVAVKTLLKTFDEILIGWGNHDFRLTRFLGHKHSFIDCMKWVLSELTEEEMSRVTFTDLDYMYLDSGERRYRICHPANFSSIPLTVPKDLAVKYGTSIITAHSHHCAMGVAKDGYNLIIESGGFYSKDHTEYIQRTTKHHEWVQGFVKFKDGVPSLYSPVLGNTQKYMN